MSDKLPPLDRPFSVTVRKRHQTTARRLIAREKQYRTHNCAVALAVREAFPTLTGVGVYALSLVAYVDGRHIGWAHDAADKVEAFDRGADLAPYRVGFAPYPAPVGG